MERPIYLSGRRRAESRRHPDGEEKPASGFRVFSLSPITPSPRVSLLLGLSLKTSSATEACAMSLERKSTAASG